jgi:hypothetical protein
VNQLLSYNQFHTNKSLVESRRELIFNIVAQFEDMKSYLDETKVIIESGIFDTAFTEAINEESLVAKMKAKFDNAIEVAKTKGKKALTDTQEKIVKLGGNIINIVKLIASKIKEALESAWKAASGYYNAEAAKASKVIKEKLDNAGEKTKNALIEEVKQLKSCAAAMKNWALSGFVSQAAKAGAEAAKEDTNESFELAITMMINEAVINGDIDFTDMVEESGSGIPFVSAIAHKMHHIPPFSLLDKVKQAAEKVAGGALNKFSYYATELAGAPGPFEFAALATIIGVVVEYNVKHAAEHQILHLIPGIGTVVHFITATAKYLAIIAIVEALLKPHGSEEEHGKEEH